MLFQDWDIEISGKHIFIGPMKEQDEESYGRLLFGNLYERFVELLDGESPTGIRKILNHTATDETHALRLLAVNHLSVGLPFRKTRKEGQR